MLEPVPDLPFQKAIGESDLSATMLYIHVYGQEVEQALKSLRNGNQ